MTTTNKYIFRLATILTLIFGVYSCSADDTTTLTTEKTVFREAEEIPRLVEDSIIVQYFDYYLSHSKIHSRGLDSLYNFIIDNGNDVDYLDLKEKIRLFCNSENIFINEGIATEDSPFMNFFIKGSRADNISNLNSLESTIENEIPLLLEILDNVSRSVETYHSENELKEILLGEIVNESFKNLSAVEQHSTLLGSAIFIDSYLYWGSNIEKWGEIYPINLEKEIIVIPNAWPPSNQDIIRYATLDAVGAGVGALSGAVQGAVVGAVTAALTGGVATPAIVVGAVAGAVGGAIGGAITASLTAVIIDYIRG